MFAQFLLLFYQYKDYEATSFTANVYFPLMPTNNKIDFPLANPLKQELFGCRAFSGVCVCVKSVNVQDVDVCALVVC